MTGYTCPVSTVSIIDRDIYEHRQVDIFDKEIGHCAKYHGTCILPKYKLVQRGDYEVYRRTKEGSFKRSI